MCFSPVSSNLHHSMKEKSYPNENCVMSIEALTVVGNVYGFCLCLTKSLPIIRSQFKLSRN